MEVARIELASGVVPVGFSSTVESITPPKRPGGFEPPTHRLGRGCSGPLSYGRERLGVGVC
jgi:hypothetical protein